jgi:hypothetical protein
MMAQIISESWKWNSLRSEAGDDAAISTSRNHSFHLFVVFAAARAWARTRDGTFVTAYYIPIKSRATNATAPAPFVRQKPVCYWVDYHPAREVSPQIMRADAFITRPRPDIFALARFDLVR